MSRVVAEKQTGTRRWGEYRAARVVSDGDIGSSGGRAWVARKALGGNDSAEWPGERGVGVGASGLEGAECSGGSK